MFSICVIYWMFRTEGIPLTRVQYWDPNVSLASFPEIADAEEENVHSSNVAAAASMTPPVMIGLEVISRLVFNDSIGLFEDPITGSTYSFDASSNSYSLVKAGTRLEEKQAKIIKEGAFAVPSKGEFSASSSVSVSSSSVSSSSNNPTTQKSQKKIKIQLQKWHDRQLETAIEEETPVIKTALSSTFVKAGDQSSDASTVTQGLLISPIFKIFNLFF